MSRKSLIILKRILNILSSASLFTAGACLIYGCLSIYYAGNGYSPQTVREAFAPISIPVYICLAFIVIGFAFYFVDPEPNNEVHYRVYSHILTRASKKSDMSAADEATLAAIRKERKGRQLLVALETLVILSCSAVFLFYAVKPDNYHTSDINSSMINAMKVLAPCLALSFAVSVCGIILAEKSMKKEAELLKLVPSKKSTAAAPVPAKADRVRAVIIFLVAVIAAVCLIYGAVSGGTADVLTKAVNICTECIGLG